MYSILVRTRCEQVGHRASLGICLPAPPKLRKWLKHKASQRHSRVRKLQLWRLHFHERTGQQKVDVDAPARVARTLCVANAPEAPLHLKAIQKQAFKFTIPFHLKYLVQKVWAIKTPRGGAPQAACAQDRGVFRQQCAGPAKNQFGVFAVASE